MRTCSRYESTETFRLLGKQYYNEIVTDENVDRLKEILKDYEEQGDLIILGDGLMCCADCFVLGYIMGQRAERGKKKAKREKVK